MNKYGKGLGVRGEGFFGRLTPYALLLTLIFSGCSLTDRGSDIFYNDVVRTMEIAEKYGDEKMAACAAVVKQQIEWVKKVSEEETRGLVSRAFVYYLMALDARGGEAKFEEACAPIVGAVAIKALRQMR